MAADISTVVKRIDRFYSDLSKWSEIADVHAKPTNLKNRDLNFYHRRSYALGVELGLGEDADDQARLDVVAKILKEHGLGTNGSNEGGS